MQTGVEISTKIRLNTIKIDPSHKSRDTPIPYPEMHHFMTEMCTCMHISVTKWCIVGYLSDALWEESIVMHLKKYAVCALLSFVVVDLAHIVQGWFTGTKTIVTILTNMNHNNAPGTHARRQVNYLNQCRFVFNWIIKNKIQCRIGLADLLGVIGSNNDVKSITPGATERLSQSTPWKHYIDKPKVGIRVSNTNRIVPLHGRRLD